MSRVAINTGAAANDGTGDTLRAAGGKINDNFLEIYSYLGAGSTTILSIPIFSATAAGINTLRNVGIGTTNPRFALEVGAVGASGTTLYVNGDARITGILTIGTSSITLNGSTNTINVGSGITINGATGIISATSIVVGGTTLTGAAVTRIEAGSGISVNQNTGQVTITATGGGGGGSGISTQWVTTSAGIHTLSNVGIGTTNPTSAFTVKGNTSLETLNVSGISTFSNNVRVSGFVTASSILVSNDGNNNGSVLIQDTGTYSEITFRASNGTDQTKLQGVEANLYITPGSSGYVSLSGSTKNIFYETGDVILNNGLQGTTHAANGLRVTGLLQVTGLTSTATLNVGTGGTVITTTSSGLVGIGTTNPTSSLTVQGDANISGVVTASSFSGSNTLKTRTTVSGVTTSIANNGIGNTNITGYKSYALLKVGLSTAGWLRLYTDSASRTADASRSQGIDPTPGSGVIAEVITTGISTTQIITPFVMGGNLDNPTDTTIYAAITNLSGVTTSISTNLTILQLEA